MKETEKQMMLQKYLDAEISVEKIREEFNLSRKIFEKLLQENLTKEQIKIRRSKKVFSKQPKYLYLIGQKIAYLTIIDLKQTEKSSDGSFRCICSCECGREADVNTNYLIRGLVKSCGHKLCVYHKQATVNNGKKNVKFKGFEEISGVRWNSIKNGAKRRNLEFSISLEYIWKLFLEQNRKCSLTGQNIFFGKTNTQETTASLDRIDSSKGYVEGNVHWVHKKINVIKMDLDLNEFIELCKMVADKFS